MSYWCGCYYHFASPDYYTRAQKHYLPLVDSEAHATIRSTTSRTVLKQVFTNSSSKDAIKECIYAFPLYDGVSVVGFTCRIGEKVITGLVKEKVKAKAIFDAAVTKGETAGLLEQAPESSDVFSTKLGNIPAGESVIVEVTYIGELKHHETDGIKFTIPTSIAPRYGSGPSVSTSKPHANLKSEVQASTTPATDVGGIKIVVDVNMPDGSFIKGVQSPSHPIAVSMGTVSTANDAAPLMSKASATLSLGSAALEKDFVLIVQSKDIGLPKAMLETHPTIPNHRALMATLVPKFSLPPSHPEIVFIADRSGSMSGNIEILVSAMKVFLKSMPAGTKFNICSFGSTYSFLWEKSQSYTRATLDEANNHLVTFAANFGGTETQKAIKATVDRRWGDIPLEIILLTDGDIWQQNELFSYINEQVQKTSGKIRVFPLGIGNGVSHSLIEGLARAGNGFAQAVQHGERLENCVVRMLRGALSPHITDYTLEVKYEQQDDDFEVIDKVTEGFKVLLMDSEKSSAVIQPAQKPTVSLFDTAASHEEEDLEALEVSLPEIPSPKLLQAPHKIPSLFAFSRTAVYLLMSPDTIQRNPTAVILRATSSHGPLALEIPIEILTTPGQTIHQLAAKKAVQDLEEGRGWIYDAKDQSGKLVKERFPSSFDDLVKKEAVRLGEKFQIAGKYCSFVAVSANNEEIARQENINYAKPRASDNDSFSKFLSLQVTSMTITDCSGNSKGGNDSDYEQLDTSALFSPHGSVSPRKRATPEEERFDAVGSSSPRKIPKVSRRMKRKTALGLSLVSPGSPPRSPGFSPTSPGYSPNSPIDFDSALAYGPTIKHTSASNNSYSQGAHPGNHFRPSPPQLQMQNQQQMPVPMGAVSKPLRSKARAQKLGIAPSPSAKVDWFSKPPAEKVLTLVLLQDFEGSWVLRSEVEEIMCLQIPENPKVGDQIVFITLIVVSFLEQKMASEEGTWALVVEKARGWLESLGIMNLEELEREAVEFVKKH